MSAVEGFVDRLNEFIVFPLLSLLIAAALLLFVWGLAQFIAGAADETKRADGRRHMIWGVVGLFIMVAVIGILRIVTTTFGVSLP